MTYQLCGYAALEQAGRLDIADAYRRVADLAVMAANSHAAGLPDPEARRLLDEALGQVDWRIRRLAAARSGYARLDAARLRIAFDVIEAVSGDGLGPFAGDRGRQASEEFPTEARAAAG